MQLCKSSLRSSTNCTGTYQARKLKGATSDERSILIISNFVASQGCFSACSNIRDNLVMSLRCLQTFQTTPVTTYSTKVRDRSREHQHCGTWHSASTRVQAFGGNCKNLQNSCWARGELLPQDTGVQKSFAQYRIECIDARLCGPSPGLIFTILPEELLGKTQGRCAQTPLAFCKRPARRAPRTSRP